MNKNIALRTVHVDRNASTEALRRQYDGVYSLLQFVNFQVTDPVAQGLWNTLNELDDELRDRDREAAHWVADWS